MTRLTPISRFLLTFAIVGSLFFGIKSLFSSQKDASNEPTIAGKQSDAPVLFSLSGSSTLGNKMMPEIAKFGIKTEVFGFGQALPIAANTGAIGQNKNRRVEVWIK